MWGGKRMEGGFRAVKFKEKLIFGLMMGEKE